MYRAAVPRPWLHASPTSLFLRHIPGSQFAIVETNECLNFNQTIRMQSIIHLSSISNSLASPLTNISHSEFAVQAYSSNAAAFCILPEDDSDAG